MRPFFTNNRSSLLMIRCLTLGSLLALSWLQMHSSDPLQERLRQIGALTVPMAVVDEGIFTKEFIRAVPAQQLTAAIQQLTATAGSFVKATVDKKKSDYSCTGSLHMSNNIRVPLELTLEATPPHRIAGLFLRPPVPNVATLDDALAELRALPGKTAFVAVNLSKGDTVAALNASQPMPLGSSFKLFVLGELVRSIKAGQRTWKDVVELSSARKSYPSGELHTWPQGSPLTVHSLAMTMISISDNTATDELLFALGRQNVEQAQSVMGHSQPWLNIPFLSTRELFQLKFTDAGERARRYYSMKPAQRRILLEEELTSLQYDDVTFVEDVVLPDSVEWFASMQDMAACMNWFRLQGADAAGKPALDIMAKNPGVSIDAGAWPYVGFKGGSETGVVCMVFLLQHSSGDWYAVSGAWVNPAAEVDSVAFAGVMQRAIELLRAN